MTVKSFTFYGLGAGEQPHLIIDLENERITVPLDGKPENEAVLARVFGEQTYEEN